MKISYQDYSDQNDHGYQYYHGIVKMCYKLNYFVCIITKTTTVPMMFRFEMTT